MLFAEHREVEGQETESREAERRLPGLLSLIVVPVGTFVVTSTQDEAPG